MSLVIARLVRARSAVVGGIVAPANAILATWQPGPLPADFYAIRNRWEGGHMVVAALKMCGFIAVALSALAQAASTTTQDRQRRAFARH
jgi:hypothetical protein